MTRGIVQIQIPREAGPGRNVTLWKGRPVTKFYIIFLNK